MHLGDGAITPECAVVTLGAAAVGMGLAAVSFRWEPVNVRKLVLAAGLGAFVFAAQAVNVPILPSSSAHLVGGVLLAWALGPGLGAWTMVLVLAIQALVLGDGGLMALGANVLNMALLPAGIVAVGRHAATAHQRFSWIRPGLLAALSVPLAALLIVGETALFRSGAELAGWSEFALRMVGVHLLVGLAEGGLTVALLAAMQLPAAAERHTFGRPAWIGLGGAAILAIASVWSSPLPDTYESSAQHAGMGWMLDRSAG